MYGLVGVALVAVGGCAVGADVDVVAEEIRIPRGSSQSLEFRAMATEGTTVLLEIVARMDAKGLGGSMFFMELEINGKPVQAAVTRTACRLINRPLISPVALDLPSSWYGHGGWRVVYAPDFEAAKAQAFYEDDPYRLVLDVTDLVKTDAPNHLRVANTASDELAARLTAEMDLIIGSVEVHTQPGASPTLTATGPREQVINRGEPGAGPARYRGQLHRGGGLEITVEGRRLLLETHISYPNAGFSRLLPDDEADREGQDDWRVSLSGSRTDGTVTAEGADYKLVRRVQSGLTHVAIADEITNRNEEASLGLIVKHAVALKPFPEADVRLAGNDEPSVNEYYSPPNPSVHIALDDIGIGMICEDDVFRSQARLWFDPATVSAGLRTDMLYLGPGESHTLRWSIYPVASPGYYDFINLVRQDWGSNYTVEGPWCFFTPDQIVDMPLEELRTRLERLGIRYACSWGGWVDPKHDPKRIGFGCEVLEEYWADYRDRLRQAVAKFREASPGTKVLVYYDSQRDTHANAGELFPDSKLTNSAGDHVSTDWGGRYSLTWSMVATLGGSFGKAMLDVVDAYMDEIGADGLYWDEMENVAYGQPLLTYDQPDGHTCLLDPETYTVKQEVGLTTLLGEGHRLAVIDKVRGKGGTLMGNGPTTTRGLLERHVQRMVEIQHNDTWCYEGNLDSPLGYASSREDFGNVTRALGMATLLVGTRLDYQYDMSPYLFPFTPIELHPGYLLGKERIVTMHSGRYGWGDREDCIVRTFDENGKLRDTKHVQLQEGRLPVELAEGEVAVLERVDQEE
jgi:hypothetical protein